MTDNFEKLLEKVIMPAEKDSVSSDGWSLGWEKLLKKFKYYKFKDLKFESLKIARLGFKNLKIVGGVVAVIVIGLLLMSGGGDEALKMKRAESVSSRDKLLEKVAELMVLPEEKPTVATIVNYETLKDKIFFKGANVGDKLLLFEKTGKAILYSPEVHKILNTGLIGEVGISY